MWTFSFFARRKYKLLRQVRKPVGGVNSSDIIEGEEVALLGQAGHLVSSSSSSGGSNESIDGGNQNSMPVLPDTPSDESSDFGDMTLKERPMPLGAEDS